MRQNALLSLIVLMLILLFLPFDGMSENPSEGIKEGRTIHLEILARHKKLDKFYQEPYLWGEVTSKPLCCISLPIEDWESLPEKDKDSLASYAASLVKKIKADPFKYAKVSLNASLASVVRTKVVAMTDDSWGIMVGSISPDGIDIGADRIARSGK